MLTHPAPPPVLAPLQEQASPSLPRAALLPSKPRLTDATALVATAAAFPLPLTACLSHAPPALLLLCAVFSLSLPQSLARWVLSTRSLPFVGRRPQPSPGGAPPRPPPPPTPSNHPPARAPAGSTPRAPRLFSAGGPRPARRAHLRSPPALPALYPHPCSGIFFPDSASPHPLLPVALQRLFPSLHSRCHLSMRILQPCARVRQGVLGQEGAYQVTQHLDGADPVQELEEVPWAVQ